MNSFVSLREIPLPDWGAGPPNANSKNDYDMAKQPVPEQQETLGEAMNKTELFLQNNVRKVCYLLLVVLAIGLAVYGYRALVQQPRIARAAEMIAQAQERFEGENPDYALALAGDENGAGFLEVIEQYGSTPSGNLAKHYAGICYLKTGDLANAAACLAKFSPVKGLPGALINAQNLGLQGDVAVEQGDFARAIKLYEKAVAAADNNLTAPMFLRKAGLAARAAGQAQQAAAYFQRVIDEYPASVDARDAEKYLGTSL